MQSLKKETIFLVKKSSKKGTMGTECESYISMYRKRDTYSTSMKITYWDEKYDWPTIKERKKGINDPVLQTGDAEQEQSRASKILILS